MTNTLANFGKFFNYIILCPPSPLFLLRKKYFQNMLFGRNGQFPPDNDKNLGEEFSLAGIDFEIVDIGTSSH